MPKVEINEAHEYRFAMNARPVPGVTSIIKAAGLMDTAHFTEDAALRGRYVHRAIELLHANDLDEETLDPTLKPFVESYRKLLGVSAFQPEFWEWSLGSDLGYAGTLDVCGKLNSRRVLFEIKSGVVPPWADIQAAAYSNLLLEATGEHYEPFTLALDPGGAIAKLKPVDFELSWARFQACLLVVQTRKEFGLP